MKRSVVMRLARYCLDIVSTFARYSLGVVSGMGLLVWGGVGRLSSWLGVGFRGWYGVGFLWISSSHGVKKHFWLVRIKKK